MIRSLFAVLPLVLGGVFVFAGVLKILDPVAFYHSIVNYHLVTGDLSWRLAHYIPWLEVMAGVGVVCGVGRPSSALILAALLLIFMGAVGSAWFRGINMECGCFGRFSGSGGYFLIFMRDFVLFVVSIYIAATAFFPARARDT